MRQPLALLFASFALVASAQNPPAPTTPATPAATPARPTPPTRSPDAPGAPPFTRIPSPGNAPGDRNGNFIIGPDYPPPPELAVVAGVPQGRVEQFTMDSADSKYYPGIAREVFGTVDPANPKTLIVETHPQAWQRAITVYIPSQYKRGTQAPLLVT